MRRGRDFAFEKGANPPYASRDLGYCTVVLYNWASAFETSGQRRSPLGIASFGKFPHFICQIMRCFYLICSKTPKLQIPFHQTEMLFPNEGNSEPKVPEQEKDSFKSSQQRIYPFSRLKT